MVVYLAYLDFRWLAPVQAGGVTFVTGLKQGVHSRVLRDREVRGCPGGC